MKVLLVNGSPNKEGCTYTALSEIAETLRKHDVESEIFWVGNKAISGCIACGRCRELKRCVIDDVVNEFASLAQNADGFIFGSPVHFAGISGHMKSFMDRLFYSGSCNFAGKPGSAIVSCRRGGATAAFEQLVKYITIRSMPMATSQYWNMVHGSNPGQVRQDEEGMQTMRTLGANMAWMLKSFEAGKSDGVPAPEYEPTIFTNFISGDIERVSERPC